MYFQVVWSQCLWVRRFPKLHASRICASMQCLGVRVAFYSIENLTCLRKMIIDWSRSMSLSEYGRGRHTTMSSFFYIIRNSLKFFCISWGSILNFTNEVIAEICLDKTSIRFMRVNQVEPPKTGPQKVTQAAPHQNLKSKHLSSA